MMIDDGDVVKLASVSYFFSCERKFEEVLMMSHLFILAGRTSKRPHAKHTHVIRNKESIRILGFSL